MEIKISLMKKVKKIYKQAKKQIMVRVYKKKKAFKK